MRICHIITGLETGGAERMLVKLLQAMDSDGMASMVISLTDKGTQGDFIEAMQIPLITLGMKRGRPTLASWWRLRGLIRQYRPDLVHGWMYHGALAALLVSGKIPLVAGIRHSLQDIRHEKGSLRLLIRILARLSPRMAAITYNSLVSRQQHEKTGFRALRGHFIPNGFDCERFRPDREAGAWIRAELGISRDSLVIGHLGRYHPMKDHASLLRAASRFIDDYPETHFVLAGTDVTATNAELNVLIKEPGLASRVHFLGERSDITALLNAFDLLTLSSAWGEAFPNVIGEAMACGVPCVATDVGDSAGIIGDTGKVVPPADPRALAVAWQALAELGPEGRQRLGQAARSRVLESFTMAAVAQQYQQLYRSLVTGSNGVAP